jgi:hypothetical protein
MRIKGLLMPLGLAGSLPLAGSVNFAGSKVTTFFFLKNA